jgi:hypothetical protein
MSVGVVIPCGAGREDNLRAVLGSLEEQTVKPTHTVVVFDGPEADRPLPHRTDLNAVVAPRFIPGKTEQLRNVGVRALPEGTDAVWFVDSDIIMAPEALQCMLEKWCQGRIVIGPYDWMGPGTRKPQPDNRSDPRWEMMWEDRWKDPRYASTGQLNVGLACFGGNLMWDRRRFEEMGGFWNQIHRGEDGELGLRAVTYGIPITCAPEARGWHMWHEVDLPKVRKENERNIPMIDARHKDLLFSGGVFVVEQDGRRFAQTCGRCGAEVSTLEYWGHRCGGS